MISSIFLVIAMFFLLIGALGINKLKGIFPKLLISSMIDTVAFIFLILGLVTKLGPTRMALKLLLILTFILLTNPVINHFITRAAFNDSKDKKEVENID